MLDEIKRTKLMNLKFAKDMVGAKGDSMTSDIWSQSRRSESAPGEGEVRTQFEIDYDRLLFSTPVRRLADKTQVFPLEKNDGVRTRLTHSHEVSNLSRSMGNRAAARRVR